MEALLVDNSSAHLEMGLGLAGPRGGRETLRLDGKQVCPNVLTSAASA